MPKRMCEFTPQLRAKFPCFKKGRDENEAECTICRPGTFVSVAHKGATDLLNHIQSAKHKKADRGESSFIEVTDFFVRAGIKFEDAVSAAEGALAFHTVRHHSSFRSMDCTSGLLKKIFPDSDIARKFSSARTKTEAIVNSVLAPQSVESALQALKDYNIPYCGVSTDGSIHGAMKIFPVIVQYFDWKNGGLQSKLIEVRNTPDETVGTITQYVKDTLEKNGLFEKCIAFTGDNYNTMFDGLWRDEEGSDVFTNLKTLLQKTTLIGVGCPAHILNNCVHHGADTLDVDVENIILKIYQYFNIYTVRTESLKEYCDFVDIEYRKLLSHSKTRWLSLFPGITRLLQVFPVLKSFFLSQSKPPAALKKFFEDDFGEIYLWHMHSFMSVFQTPIEEIGRENNSVVEVLKCLDSVRNLLRERKAHNFMSLKVKELLGQNRKEGFAAQCDSFCAQVECQYATCLDYLEMWTQPLEEFSIFMWIALAETPNWTDAETTVQYLREKGVLIDDVKCFDQFANLRKFVESMCDDADFKKLLAHQKWTKYFESAKSVDCHSELLKIAQFFFAVPSHSANVEHIFSLMQSQWTKERNQMSVETLKGILQVQYNYKQMSCKEFHTFLLNSQALLRKLRSTEKYSKISHEKAS